MKENIKKVLFGGYNKKNTMDVLEALSDELASSQKLHQQTEKEKNEIKARLTELEKQDGTNQKLIHDLRQKNEDQQKEIWRLNTLLEESLKTVAEYNNSISRIGEVYTLAYDSAYKMAENAQNSAEEFVGVVCDNVIDAQNELSKLKFAALEIKSSIAQRLEQLRRQFLSLQEHLLAIADEELELADTVNELTHLKDKTIEKIGEELKQYSLKNKILTPSKLAPNPLDVIMRQLKTIPVSSSSDSLNVPVISVPAEEKKEDVPVIIPEEASVSEDTITAQVSEKEQAEITKEANEKEKSSESSETVSTTPLADQILEAKNKPVELNQEALNKKPTSVKDILKKYGNL